MCSVMIKSHWDWDWNALNPTPRSYGLCSSGDPYNMFLHLCCMQGHSRAAMQWCRKCMDRILLKTPFWVSDKKHIFPLFKPLWTLSHIKCAAVTEFRGKKTSCYLNIDFVGLEMTFHNINTRSYRSKWDFIRLGSHKLCGCHRWYILVDSCDPLMPNREQRRKRGRWHRLCLALAWQSSCIEQTTGNIIRVHKNIFLFGPDDF